MSDIIKLTDIRLAFGPEVIYDRLSFSVRDGEFLCVLGPSGCGKSTLLRIIGDLLKVDRGEVTVDERPGRDAWQEIAYVFQSPRLLPWRNAEGNVALAQELRFGRRVKRAEVRARARELLRLVGLGKDMHKMPHMLSGGERQRVSIARALAVDPRIVLMDEPFSALDINTRRRMRREIIDIWKRTGKTIVFVTHEVEEALELADRIIVLSSKPAFVSQVIEITVERPRALDSAQIGTVRTTLTQLLGPPPGAEIPIH